MDQVDMFDTSLEDKPGAMEAVVNWSRNVV